MSHFHSSSRNSDGNTISILPSIYKERRKSFLEVLNNILHDFEQLKRENIIKEIEKTIIDNLTSEKENFMMKALNMIGDEINQNKRSLQKIHNTQKSIQKNYYKQNPSTLSRINSQNINKTTICKIRNEISELQLTISNDFSSFQSSLSDAKFKILESLQSQKLKNQSLKRKNSHLKMIIKEQKRQVDDICSSYDSFFEDGKNLNFEPMHFTSPNSPSKSYHFTSSSSIQKGPRFTSRSSSSLTSVSESDFSDLSCIESEKEKRLNQLEMQIQQNNLEIQELRNSILQKDSIISSQEQSIRMIGNERNEPHAINNLLSDLQQKTSKIESILLKDCSHGSNFAVNQENEKLKKQLFKEKKKVHDLNNERRGFDQQINDYKKKIYEYENRLKLLSNSECKDPNHKNLIYNMEQLKIQNSNIKKDLIEAQTIAKKYKEQKIALQKELDKVKEENTILKINIPSPQKQLPFSDVKEHVKCTVCKKVIIDEKELVVLKNNPYHKKCVKCMSCDHPFNLPDQENEIIFINSTTFLCEDHYNKYQEEEELPENIQKVYQKETKDNLVKVLFDNNDFFSKNEIIDQPPENVFISEELIKDSYQIKKPYELIVPTAKCHIEMPAEEIDYELVKKCLGDNLVIVGVNKGSTILTLALIGMKNIDDKIMEKFQSIINKFKDKVKTTMGQTVVSNFYDGDIKVPEPEEINQLLRKPSINILQNAAEIENINLDDCKEIIINNLSNERNVDWKFLFNQQNLFHEFEQKLKDDIKKNPFEVILIGETVIANKYFNEFEKIRKKLSENASCEFVYHGSMLANHCKIVQEHFKNKMTTDKGFYGKGIYATDNLFYAAYYANKLHYLKIKEKTYIIACAAIYNQSEVKEITDMSYFGQTIKSDIKENYGIHKALVGNTKNFYPIWPNEKERNDIVAEEYVFPQKYQICPILSLMIMRTDHFILWKDDHIHNDENSKYLEEISKKTEINFYQEDSNKRALDFIKLKKRNKIKLITNGGDNGNSRILIQDARKIIRSDFVCLVFARSNSHKDWVTKMKNVLFTTDPEDFKKFVALKMDQKDILGFINYLQEKHTDTKFNINESELLKFPLASKPIK